MPAHFHTGLERPATSPLHPGRKSIAQRGAQDGIQSIQSSTLMFVNVSNPAESKRQDNRKAVRKFVMKQYRQSQKTSPLIQLEQAELDEGDDDDDEPMRDAPLIPHIADETDPSSSSKSSDWEEALTTSNSSKFQSPDLAIVWPVSSPVSTLGSGSLDPFDSYPDQVEMRVHELLEMCECISLCSVYRIRQSQKTQLSSSHLTAKPSLEQMSTLETSSPKPRPSAGAAGERFGFL